MHVRRAIFEGGLLQGFDWIAWSVVGLQVPLAPSFCSMSVAKHCPLLLKRPVIRKSVREVV